MYEKERKLIIGGVKENEKSRRMPAFIKNFKDINELRNLKNLVRLKTLRNP